MLTNLRIQNFKAWRDTGPIRLAPLTILFGTNSSGKSSIQQFLLMLKQTAQSPDRQRVLFLGDEKTAIDLGSYSDIVFKHGKEKNNILFDMEWELPSKLIVKDIKSERVYEGNTIGFSAEILGNPRRSSVREHIPVNKMRYALGNPDNKGLEIGIRRNVKITQTEPTRRYKIYYELFSESYDFARNVGRVWEIPAPVKFYGFPDEVIAYYQNADFVRDFTLSLENILGSIYYLGPLREPPRRSYTWTGETPEHVGWRGEASIDAMLSARGREISAGNKRKYRTFQEIIALWLKRMGLIDEFKIRKDGKRNFEVLVKTNGSNDVVNIKDVGFGVSQILPVLVQCFYAPDNSIIIFEQPEIHLHPSVQSALADLFIEVIKSKKDGRNRNIQLIVESHSEHFLRRLQLRMAEEKILPEETAIYFCENKPSGAKMEPLELDEYGNISNWPDNFFGDEISDLAQKEEAEYRRRSESEGE